MTPEEKRQDGENHVINGLVEMWLNDPEGTDEESGIWYAERELVYEESKGPKYADPFRLRVLREAIQRFKDSKI